MTFCRDIHDTKTAFEYEIRPEYIENLQGV